MCLAWVAELHYTYNGVIKQDCIIWGILRAGRNGFRIEVCPNKLAIRGPRNGNIEPPYIYICGYGNQQFRCAYMYVYTKPGY